MKTFYRILNRHLVVAAGLSLLALTATAQDLRIGAVNLERILREANLAKAAQTKLEREFSAKEKEVQGLAAQIKSASEKFEREAPTLPEAQRNARQRQLVDQDREFQRKQREFQEDLALRKNEELQTVVDRANRVIKQLAESEKYDFIIQEAVYINPKHDITDKVLSGLNSGK
ncbi:OmpH family outer membrane protein [Hydrogenophaga sp. BPS33]|uniref:OmpH family outer membrane protein n=1 Tax=Hydrogenophaga sp. BPS33 TaxID=2651974 RepID=UPI0013203304|nr:OmpH family outer membrane protein [Hydrogenophaga sp. BPS33]QHE85782.1 OmpH family outer membrane protein [Hydrogenophaga sp. BPS33]